MNPKDLTLPYIISFKGKSLRNGKVLNTAAFVKAAMANSFPPAHHYILKGTKDSNEKGTYVVISAERSCASSMDEVKVAAQWKRTFMAGGVQEHDVDDEVSPASATQTTHVQGNPDF